MGVGYGERVRQQDHWPKAEETRVGPVPVGSEELNNPEKVPACPGLSGPSGLWVRSKMMSRAIWTVRARGSGGNHEVCRWLLPLDEGIWLWAGGVVGCLQSLSLRQCLGSRG